MNTHRNFDGFSLSERRLIGVGADLTPHGPKEMFGGMRTVPEKPKDQNDVLRQTDGRVKATEAAMNQFLPAVQAEHQQFVRNFYSMRPDAREIYFLQSNAELQKRVCETPGYPVCRIDPTSLTLIIRPPLPGTTRLSMQNALSGDPDSSEHLIALNIQDEFRLFLKRYQHALRFGGPLSAKNELDRGNAELARRAGLNVDSSYAQTPTWYPQLSIVLGPNGMPMLVDAGGGSVAMNSLSMPRGPMARGPMGPRPGPMPRNAPPSSAKEGSGAFTLEDHIKNLIDSAVAYERFKKEGIQSERPLGGGVSLSIVQAHYQTLSVDQKRDLRAQLQKRLEAAGITTIAVEDYAGSLTLQRAALTGTTENLPEAEAAIMTGQDFVRSLRETGPQSADKSMQLADRLIAFLARLIGIKDFNFRVDGNTYSVSRRPDGRLSFQGVGEKLTKEAQQNMVEWYLRGDARDTDATFNRAKGDLRSARTPLQAERARRAMSDALTREDVKRVQVKERCAGVLMKGSQLLLPFLERGDKLKDMRAELDDILWKTETSEKASGELMAIAAKFRAKPAQFVSQEEKALVAKTIVSLSEFNGLFDLISTMLGSLGKAGFDITPETRGNKVKMTVSIPLLSRSLDVGSIIVDENGTIVCDARLLAWIIEEILSDPRAREDMKAGMLKRVQSGLDRIIAKTGPTGVVERILHNAEGMGDMLHFPGGEVVYGLVRDLVNEELKKRGINEQMPEWKALPH